MPSSANSTPKKEKSSADSSMEKKMHDKKPTTSNESTKCRSSRKPNSPENGPGFTEQCNVCQRTFRDSDHLTKHKRGALCRRLVQQVARKHRKLALTAQRDVSDDVQGRQNTSPPKKKLKNNVPTYVFKPYQCNICNARFYDKVNVALHLEREHNTTQQLWVEVSKIKNNIEDRNTMDIATTQCSSSNTFLNNDNGNSSCLDINNTSFYNNLRVKCLECNAQFNSENDLNEHKRINHSSGIDGTTLSSNSLSHPRNMNPYISNATPVNCSSESSLNLPSENKNMTLSNINVNNQQASHAGYIFPTNYYNSDPSTSMHHQQALLNPNVSLYNINHQPSHSHQHHNQNILTQHLLPHQHQSDHSLIHQNNLGEQYTQFNNMPVSAVNHLQSNVSVPQHVQNSILNTTPHESVLSSNDSSNNLNIPNSVDGSSNDMNENHNISNSSENYNSNLTNDSHYPTVNSKTRSNSNNNSATTKNQIFSLPHNVNTTTKWNMCGECGVKFLDLMNLELHVERKHPELKILGSVVLGDGTVCYKTGIVTNKGGSKNTSVSKEAKITQKHTCVLCNNQTESLVSMVEHVTSAHYLRGKNMLNAIISTGETYDCNDKKSNKEDDSTIPNKSKRVSSTKAGSSRENNVQDTSNQCHSCLRIFKTSAEVIRHCIKDKKHTCVVCCFVTCSKHELFEHMKSEHQNWNDFNNLTSHDHSSIRKKLSCFQCGQEYKKTGELLDHLESHGSLTGKCEKCGKQDYNVATVLIHMTTLHPHYMNKLKVTILSKGKTSSGVYMQSLSGDLLDFSTGNKDRNKDNSNKSRNSLNNEVTTKTNNKSKIKRKISGDVTNTKVFACSQCKICLYSDSGLENHLKKHQQYMKSTSLPESFNPNNSKIGLKYLSSTKGYECDHCGLVSEDQSDVIIDHIQKVHMSGNLIHLITQDDGSTKKYPIAVITPISSL